MKNYFLKPISLVLLVFAIGFTACDKKDDEPTNPAPTVDFQFVANGHEVTFTSTATNAKTYAWEFGDGETSTEANPVHTYASGGDYSVKCTATGDGGSKSTTKTVTIDMTDDEILAGTWKLDIAVAGQLIDISNGNEDDLPIGFLTIYSLGSTYDDTFTFGAGGSLDIVTNGQSFGGLISAMAVLQLGSLPELIEAAGDGRITLPTDPSTGNPTIELGVCKFNHTAPTGTWTLSTSDVTVNEGTDNEVNVKVYKRYLEVVLKDHKRVS